MGQPSKIHELEAEVARLIPGPSRHWTSEGFAQGVLLDVLERLGFRHRALPPLEAGDQTQTLAVGSRFERGGRSFAAYDADAGVALVMAALLAIRAEQRPRVLA
jgi:hypothetical protein